MKLMMIGPDSAVPAFVFERWRDELSNLLGLFESGAGGQMTSTYPPITVLSQVAGMALQVAAL
jgi:predicted AlkP superfamily phosphohydrolase/phosphomutase